MKKIPAPYVLIALWMLSLADAVSITLSFVARHPPTPEVVVETVACDAGAR